jgi:hypothetical protein
MLTTAFVFVFSAIDSETYIHLCWGSVLMVAIFLTFSPPDDPKARREN